MSHKIYVIVGSDALDMLDALVSFAEELGVKLHLVISPRRIGGFIIDGMLVENIEELPGKLLEAYALALNMDGLILACCG